jgi:hypothetical protein
MKKFLILAFLGLGILAARPAGAAVAPTNLSEALSQWLRAHPVILKNYPPTLLKVNQNKDLTVKVGQRALWQLYARDPEGGTLRYAATWGDEIKNLTPFLSNFAMTVGDLTEMGHVYERPGLYEPVFEISDPAGLVTRLYSRITVLP